MSGCWFAEVEGRLACTVHCAFYPCERDGQPADPTPIHIVIGPDEPDSLAHESWRLACAGRRPLVLHRGLIGGDSLHVLLGPCWCSPALVDPEEETGQTLSHAERKTVLQQEGLE